MPHSKNHDFIPRTTGDSRSPCPALNALANHGYIPRNGRDITLKNMICALREVYHLSFPLATLLSLVAFIFCGRGTILNLHDLAAHNVIEHDASLVHDDALFNEHFAPSSPNEVLLRNLLRKAYLGRGLSLNDLASVRVERESHLSKPLDSIHSQIAVGESALAWLVMRDQQNEVISTRTIQEWFGEERLSDGWTRPVNSIGLKLTNRTANNVAMLVKGLKG